MKSNVKNEKTLNNNLQKNQWHDKTMKISEKSKNEQPLKKMKKMKKNVK